MNRRKMGQKGFTLVELTFVIAIIVVLLSIMLPTLFSQIDKSKTTRADADIQEIAAGIMAFFNDLDKFPNCSANCDSSFTKGIRYLAFGDGFGDLSADYPSETATWNLKAAGTSVTAANNGANHLVVNDPVSPPSENGSGDYKTSGSGKAKRWQGPYLSRVTFDPFGKTYIAYVGAMDSGGTKLSGISGTHRGWIISAGPNNALNTAPTDTSLSSDDQGFILTSK